MKKINYKLTDGDIEAIIFCLKLIPFVDFDDVSPAQQSINLSLSLSAIEKLYNRDTNISANEYKIMTIALDLAYLISVNDPPYDISEKADTDFSPYIFSINKLRNVFCELI